MNLFLAWIAAFGFAALISFAALGYGCMVGVLTRNARSAIVLGLGFYCTAIMVTGVWGGYNKMVQTLMVAVGVAGAFTYRRQLRRFMNVDWPAGLDRLWLALPFVYWVTRFFTSGLPQQHSDALYYHLPAAQLWAELGAIKLTPEHPSYAQASLWETLYGIPQIWIGTKGATNHVVTQVYAQWMHFFWGQVGTAFVAAGLLKQLAEPLKVRPGLAIFLGWLATTLPAFEWTGCLAKNDYIIMLFVLASVIEALERRWLLAGLLMGFAYSTKVIAAWAAIAMLSLLFTGTRQLLGRYFFSYATGILFGVAAYTFRNLFSTGNPVFPTLDNVLGPHWVSTLWNNHNLSFGGAPKFDSAMFGWLWNKMFEKALPKTIMALGLVALAIEALRRRIPRDLHIDQWLVFLFVGTLLPFLMLRPGADGRYGNFTASLIAVFALAAVVRAAHAHGTVARYGVPVLALLGLLVNSPIDQLYKIPRDYLFEHATKYVEYFHYAYDMQSWVQKNLPPGARIAFMAEKQGFYLDRPFETISEMKKWDPILDPIKSAPELISKLREQGFDYLHVSPDTGGYPPVIRPYWKELLAMKKRIVYSSQSSIIFDLRR